MDAFVSAHARTRQESDTPAFRAHLHAPVSRSSGFDPRPERHRALVGTATGGRVLYMTVTHRRLTDGPSISIARNTRSTPRDPGSGSGSGSREPTTDYEGASPGRPPSPHHHHHLSRRNGAGGGRPADRAGRSLDQRSPAPSPAPDPPLNSSSAAPAGRPAAPGGAPAGRRAPHRGPGHPFEEVRFEVAAAGCLPAAAERVGCEVPGPEASSQRRRADTATSTTATSRRSTASADSAAARKV